MASIFLFTGENAFQLREEKRRWTGEFEKKYGHENHGRIDGAKISLRDLLDEVAVQPFLAEKRMVVVEGVPKFTKEDIQSLANQVHPQVILLFIDPKIDKRTSGAKELLNVADVKEFKQIKGPALSSWFKEYSARHGLSMNPAAQEMLMQFTGDDQDILAREIEKLALYANGRTLTTDDIEKTVIPTDEGVIWKISDLLAAGSKNEALDFARRLTERGGDAYGLWAILLNMLKNLVSVSAAIDAGHTSGKDIADATGVHVFAVRSLQTHARRASGKKLKDFLAWSVQADKDLKTGVFRSTDDAQQELLSLIERFILSCP